MHDSFSEITEIKKSFLRFDDFINQQVLYTNCKGSHEPAF